MDNQVINPNLHPEEGDPIMTEEEKEIDAFVIKTLQNKIIRERLYDILPISILSVGLGVSGTILVLELLGMIV